MSAENTLTVRLVECAKTAAQWAALLTIPKRGEICLEMENQGTNENPDLLYKMKIGDGIHTYANLNYFPVDDNIAQVVANWVEQNLDVNEYAQASYDNSTKTLSVYGIKEVDGKIVKGTNHVDIQLAEGTKIDITSAEGVITIAHEATTRTDTTKSSAGFGTKVVTGVTTDSTGHVTGVETGPLPTKPATKNVIGTSDAATTDGASANPYLNHIEDGDVKSHHQLIGGTQVDVNSDASGNVTIKHETITRSDAEESAQPTNLVTEITTANGHVTGAKTINPDDLIVGIAKDLDAPVTRSDDSMWNHRVTGGTINIGEETAKISKLRGNTLVWNQLVENGNFSDDLNGWSVVTQGTIDVANNVLSYSWESSYSNNGIAQVRCPIIASHKYYIAGTFKNTADGARAYRIAFPYNFSFGVDGTFSAGQKKRISAIKVAPVNSGGQGLNLTISGEINKNNSIEASNIVCFDLTKMFGADKEPTVEEFEAMFPNSYYPYNEGELISLKPDGIKSVGFNQWDEEWENGSIQYSDGTLQPSSIHIRTKNYIKVVPNETYYFSVPTSNYNQYCRGAFYDSNYNYLGTEIGWFEAQNVSVLVPKNAAWCKLYFGSPTYHNDICINLSDPSRNGTYEPYKESTLDLSWIKSIKDNNDNLLFPDGELHSAGSVYDEVGDSYAVKRIGNRNYTSTDDEDSTVITDGTTTYYPLAEPVTVYFDKKPMIYPVDDLGTETLLPEGVGGTTGAPLSAPFNGTFEYKSNFKDAVIDLINAVNNYKNPVRGKDNSDQTVGQLAEYDSDSTIKASGYKASNATISPTGSDNASILPTVAALIAYVQGVAQNALHYQGTVVRVADLPSTGTAAGDVYILSQTDGNYDAGDWFIRNKANDGWDVVQGSVRVTNNDITLNPDGTKKTIANVEGTPITVTMPDMNFAEPAASGDTLTVIDTISQSNGKISATKKAIQDASKSQKGVVQFVTDVHNSTDQTKAVTAGDAWTEFAKRNVKAVDVSQSTPINLFPSVLISSSAPSASTAPSNWDSSIYGTWTGAPQFVGQLFVSTSGSASIATGTSDVTDWKPITNN